MTPVGMARGLLALVAPMRCLGCDAPMAQRQMAFCGACRPLVEPWCDAGAVFEYGGPVADAVRRFKYGDRSELGAQLGGLMADRARECWAGAVELVIPVPLHWRRRRQRGYDQAALLVAPIAKALGARSGVGMLRRIRNTPRQVALSHTERLRNMRGAFAASKRLGEGGLAQCRVLLVDDVRTTGATMAAASVALRDAGASTIYNLTFARRV